MNKESPFAAVFCSLSGESFPVNGISLKTHIKGETIYESYEMGRSEA